MSPDEVVVTVVAAFIGLVFWTVRILGLAQIRHFRPVPAARQVGRLLIALVTGLFLALRFWAADDVRTAPEYLLMYAIVGLAWLRLGEGAFALIGLSARADLAERGTAAAWPAWAGALTGLACCYLGGNIGNGPGWWVVVFASGLASLSWFVTWAVLEVTTRITEAVTVDRDMASGVRLGGFLAATGLVCGRAAAGDWISASATVGDFAAVFWPVVLVLGAAVLVEGRWSPQPGRPVAPVELAGHLPAAMYVGAAVAYLWALGWP